MKGVKYQTTQFLVFSKGTRPCSNNFFITKNTLSLKKLVFRGYFLLPFILNKYKKININIKAQKKIR